MDVTAFYSTASGLCFTLLGFWWAVVQFRHNEWMERRDRRRMAYAVSLHFLLPGIMSLLALVISTSPVLWRTTFAIAGASGIIAVILILTSMKSTAGSFQFAFTGLWIGLPIYALITLFAVISDLPSLLGLGLKPLELEAVFLSLLVFLGANIAWVLFAAPKEPDTTAT